MKNNHVLFPMLICLSALSLTLFACGGSSDNNPPPPPPPNGEQSDTPPPNPSTDTIKFVNGLWQPDLSTAEVGQTSNGWYHNGLSIVDDYAVNNTRTSVRITDKADGSMGKVMTVYYGNLRNLMSASLRLLFDTPQPEFWLRFNYRIAAGQTLTDLFEHKIIYAFTGGSAAVNVDWPGQGDQVILQPRNTSEPEIYYPRVVGWTDLYGTTSASADGSYHSFEFHLSIDGVFQMWVDNVLVANSTGLDLGTNAFTYVYIPHNHNRYNLELAAHDIDGIKTATPDYTGFIKDAAGNNMIGK